MLTYAQLVDAMQEASAVVCHAGVGTVMTALSAGRTPVIIPRLRRFHEAVDDHQLQLVRALTEKGLVVPVLPGDDIAARVAEAKTRAPALGEQQSRLQRAVAAAVAAA